jgi:hypothetical protein
MKLKQQSEQESHEGAQHTKTKWSSSKSERQTALQKRREEMILAARKKLMAKNAGDDGS